MKISFLVMLCSVVYISIFSLREQRVALVNGSSTLFCSEYSKLSDHDMSDGRKVADFDCITRSGKDQTTVRERSDRWSIHCLSQHSDVVSRRGLQDLSPRYFSHKTPMRKHALLAIARFS